MKLSPAQRHALKQLANAPTLSFNAFVLGVRLSTMWVLYRNGFVKIERRNVEFRWTDKRKVIYWQVTDAGLAAIQETERE